MINEIWERGMKAVFVSPALLEASEKLGFDHLHASDRFWELLELGGITPARVVTSQERKALAEGIAQGSLSDPVRLMFIEKKTSQLHRLGIGVAQLNRRIAVPSEKDRLAIPESNDIAQFLDRVEALRPKILGFITPPEIFLQSFQGQFPGLTGTPGRQEASIGGAEVWLLGSTVARLRGPSLRAQEDLFFALGEHLSTPS